MSSAVPSGMAETRSVYMTFPDLDVAMSVGRRLVDEHLAACVNVVPRVVSVYRWEGQVHNEEEVVAFAKTTAARVDALIDRAKELHPFEVPCIVALDVVAGLPAFLDWVEEETREP